MAARKVSKESSPEVVRDAAKALGNKHSSAKLKELAGSVISTQGTKKPSSKSK
jgi:hypothetical protein